VKIAYLCAQYPAVSHTFILREVEALRELGVDIHTFSIRRAGSEHLLTDADRSAFESTFAIRPRGAGALLGAHLRLLQLAPAAYVTTLARALRTASPGLRGRLWQFFYFVQAVVLWSECRDRGVRHVHAHLANVAADVALLSARIGCATSPGAPWSWSFTMHGPTEFFDVRHHRLAEKLREASFVVCISDYARSQMMTLGDIALWEKLHVIRVGLPLERFQPSAAEERDERQTNTTILCVGRLVPEKGQAVLLAALAQLVGAGHELTVMLAGEGPSRSALERIAKRLGVADRVVFRGAVGQDEIRALYAEAAIFCLPSFAEGIPVVLMEAMAMGRPVVSTRITGIPELIEDGRDGLLVAPGRADELAGALERLLADASLCRELGASAQRKVGEEFDLRCSAPALRALFAQRLAGSGAAVGG
jgi:colanic acid/amylovoran biosynthesis glycosyltransferase